MVAMVARRRASWLFPSSTLVAVLGSAAAFAADANNGERIARRWCAPCHVVASNQRGPTGEAPPFATVAAKPDFDAAKLATTMISVGMNMIASIRSGSPVQRGSTGSE